MASKNKRMASRQSRVRERRRRGGGRGRASAIGAAGTREIRRGVWRTPDGGELASAGVPTMSERVSDVHAPAASDAASQSAAIT